jgi:hypothetical protein
MIIAWPCPDCGQETTYQLGCPGHIVSSQSPWITVCHPSCRQAIRFFCKDVDCPWWYLAPNRRNISGMSKAPSWYEEAHAVIMALENTMIEEEIEEETQTGKTDEIPVIQPTTCPIGLPFIHYVAYNHKHLVGILLEITSQTDEGSYADLWMLGNMNNVAGKKNFSEQFHQDVKYSLDPIPGTWHWIKES